METFWNDTRKMIMESPPHFKIFCAVFILMVNYSGTSPFFEPFFTLHIWTLSLLANIVFIAIMTLTFFWMIRISSLANNIWLYLLSPLLTTILVTIGCCISWFFVIIGTNGERIGPEDISFDLMDFLAPVSPGMDFGDYELIVFGWNALWIPTIYMAVIIFTTVPWPVKQAE